MQFALNNSNCLHRWCWMSFRTVQAKMGATQNFLASTQTWWQQRKWMRSLSRATRASLSTPWSSHATNWPSGPKKWTGNNSIEVSNPSSLHRRQLLKVHSDNRDRLRRQLHSNNNWARLVLEGVITRLPMRRWLFQALLSSKTCANMPSLWPSGSTIFTKSSFASSKWRKIRSKGTIVNKKYHLLSLSGCLHQYLSFYSKELKNKKSFWGLLRTTVAQKDYSISDNSIIQFNSRFLVDPYTEAPISNQAPWSFLRPSSSLSATVRPPFMCQQPSLAMLPPIVLILSKISNYKIIKKQQRFLSSPWFCLRTPLSCSQRMAVKNTLKARIITQRINHSSNFSKWCRVRQHHRWSCKIKECKNCTENSNKTDWIITNV